MRPLGQTRRTGPQNVGTYRFAAVWGFGESSPALGQAAPSRPIHSAPNAANQIEANSACTPANEIHSDTPGGAITQHVGPAWVDPAYDAAGNMTAGPRPGAIGEGETRQWLVYDAWNRLVAVYEDSDDNGVFDPGGADARLAAYRYDGLHRMIVRTDADDVDFDYCYNTAWQVLENG